MDIKTIEKSAEDLLINVHSLKDDKGVPLQVGTSALKTEVFKVLIACTQLLNKPEKRYFVTPYE